MGPGAGAGHAGSPASAVTLGDAWQLEAPGSLPQRVGQVDVTLCHDGAVQVWELASHLCHHLLQQVLLLAAFHVILARVRGRH